MPTALVPPPITTRPPLNFMPGSISADFLIRPVTSARWPSCSFTSVHHVLLAGEPEGRAADGGTRGGVGLPHVGGADHAPLDAAGDDHQERIVRHLWTVLLALRARQERGGGDDTGERDFDDHGSSSEQAIFTIARRAGPDYEGGGRRRIRNGRGPAERDPAEFWRAFRLLRGRACRSSSWRCCSPRAPQVIQQDPGAGRLGSDPARRRGEGGVVVPGGARDQPARCRALTGAGIAAHLLGRGDQADLLSEARRAGGPGLRAGVLRARPDRLQPGGPRSGDQVLRARRQARARAVRAVYQQLEAWKKEAALHGTFAARPAARFTVMFEGPAQQADRRARVGRARGRLRARRQGAEHLSRPRP